MRKGKHGGYKFTKKKQSVRGMLAFALALISIAAGIGMVAVSVQNRGNAQAYVGSVGVLALLVSVAALGIGMKSMGEEGSFKLFPVLGTVFASLSMLAWITVYGAGFYLGS